MSRMIEDDLKKIFNNVRNSFIWTADGPYKTQWKGGSLTIKDHWELIEPDKNGILRGDCEDFCLYISKVLREKLNIPKSQRLLTYSETETGEGHMILCVVVEGKEFVFDNRQRVITTRQKLKRAGYKSFARPVGSVAGPWKHL